MMRADVGNVVTASVTPANTIRIGVGTPAGYIPSDRGATAKTVPHRVSGRTMPISEMESADRAARRN